MHISLISPEETPTTRVVVVVDMYTFSTTLPVLLAKNPARLYCVGGNFEEAKERHRLLPDPCILIDDAVQEPDYAHLHFNANPLPMYYNSDYFRQDISQATFLYRSTNGSQLVAKLAGEHTILIASLVNLNTLLQFCHQHALTELTLVMAGTRGQNNVDDRFCAEYMRAVLTQGHHDTTYYLDCMRRIVAEGTNPKTDFFARHMTSSYASLLGFAMSCDLVLVLPHVAREEDGMFLITHHD